MEWLKNLFRPQYLEWNEYVQKLSEVKEVKAGTGQELQSKTELIFSS
jgi:hypothetical protein